MDAGSPVRAQLRIDHSAGLHASQVPHTPGSCHQQHGSVPHTTRKVDGKGIFCFDFTQQQRDRPELRLIIHAVRHRNHHKPLCRNIHGRQEHIPEILYSGAGFSVRQMHGRFGVHQLTAQCQNVVRAFFVLS